MIIKWLKEKRLRKDAERVLEINSLYLIGGIENVKRAEKLKSKLRRRQTEGSLDRAIVRSALIRTER